MSPLEAARFLQRKEFETKVITSARHRGRREALLDHRKTNKVVLLHEDSRTGSIAGEIAAIINKKLSDDLLRRAHRPDHPRWIRRTVLAAAEEYFLPR